MQLFYKGDNSHLYLEGSGRSRKLIKTPASPYAKPHEIGNLDNEYRTTHDIDSPYIRKALDETTVNGQYAVVFEFFDGAPLDEIYPEGTDDWVEFYQVTISLAIALNEIHKLNIIHRNLSGANVLYNEASKLLKVIDFGLATRISQKVPYSSRPVLDQQSLSYISPEQTGLVNRKVDYRTDLYSLGVIYYQLVTGQPPFQSDDPAALVHSHLAQKPTPLSEVRKDVPPSVDTIISKLLEKNPELRYQSAAGLLADLEESHRRLFAKGDKAFEVGLHDYSDRFLLPQKLYGVKEDLELLVSAFERVSTLTTNSLEFITVTGVSGVGKSALVNELHQPIGTRGRFIRGKYDLLKRNIPYFAIIQALQDLVRQLLAEEEHELTDWKDNVLGAVENSGEILTDLIPELERIIGEQPELPDLGNAEYQARFKLVLTRFFQATCSVQRPIVLFLDDLQWADLASLDLLKHILLNQEIQHFLLIGGYRDNEVDEDHPLSQLLNDVASTSCPMSDIRLRSLSPESVQLLVGDTLNDRSERIDELTKLVISKTEGNAFFTHKFLKSLYEDGFIQFDHKQSQSTGRSCWKWDTKTIAAQNITDNVVDLMKTKVKGLDEQTQKPLQVAACIGNRFNLSTIAGVLGERISKVQEELLPAIDQELIIPENRDFTFTEGEGQRVVHVDNYRFVHDQIQQAAYALIPEGEPATYHLQVGRLMLGSFAHQDKEDRIFEIANQFDLALEHLVDPSERLEVAQLNLEAGQRARQSAAFETAYRYARSGIQLLLDTSWADNYDLSLSLYTLACEAAWMSTAYEEMDELVDTVLQHARTPLEKVRIYEVKMEAHFAQLKPGTVEIGLEALAALGVKLPSHPGNFQILLELIRTKWLLLGKKPADLIHLPEMNDPLQVAIMRVALSLSSFAYLTHPNLLPLLTFKLVQTTLKHGINGYASVGFGMYGVILNVILGDVKSSIAYGELVKVINDRYYSKRMHSQNIQINTFFNNHWHQPIREDAALYRESYKFGMESGELNVAFLAGTFAYLTEYVVGRNLSEIRADMVRYMQYVGSMKYQNPVKLIDSIIQLLDDWITEKPAPYYLDNSVTNEEDLGITGTQFTLRMAVAYHMGNIDRALELIDVGKKYLDAMVATIWIPIYHYYKSLILLAEVSRQGGQSTRSKRTIRQGLKKLKKWSEMGPMNYGHKYYLVLAEYDRVNGKTESALTHYMKAVEGARENQFLNEEALARELTGKFFLEKGEEVMARHYLYDAARLWQSWGALTKVHSMEQDFAWLHVSVEPLTDSSQANVLGPSMPGPDELSGRLDLQSIIKASTSISGEMRLSALLEKLMKIIMQTGGATYGALILEKDGKLSIEAEVHQGEDEVNVLQSKPVKGTKSLSERVVMYVYRSHETEVLNDISNEERFTHDRYVKEKQPKSVLCAPVIHQGKLTALIYLENNLTTGAFTPERMGILNLLSGQIAVSIQNAMVYEDLEQIVADRTHEIKIEKQKSDKMLQIKDKFFSIISHDLRGPVSAFNGITSIIKMYIKKQRYGDLEKMTGEIDDSVRQLSGLLDNLLNWASQQQSELPNNPENIELAALVEQLFGTLKLVAESKSIQLEQKVDHGVEIYADRNSIMTVLRNLVGNALKFTPENGKIEVTAAKEGEDVRIRVKDTGIGIPREKLKTLFQLSDVKSTYGTRGEKGVGLGLQLVHELTKMNQGRVEVTSVEGEGTTFLIILPAPVSQEADSEIPEVTGTDQ